MFNSLTDHACSEVQSTANEATAPTGVTYTWEDVNHRLGAATAEELKLFALSQSKVELIRRGTRIGSEKITTDLVR